MNSSITCPNCQAQIEITEVISSQLRATIRGELETELSATRQRLKQHQDELARQQGELQKKTEAMEEQVRAKLAQERQSLERRIREQMHVEIKDRDEQLGELRQQLQTAQEKEVAARKREREIEQLRTQLDQEKLELEQNLRKKLEEERAGLVRQAREKAKEELALELKDRETALAELQAKVQQANQKELAFLKEKRELQEKIQSVELEVTRRTQEELKKVREQALKELDEQHRLKLLEKEQQVEALRRQIEDLKRSAEQGSQQMQGEVLEVALEELLKDLFPTDSIEPVPKGVRGADVIQRVFDDAGMDCGLILWESKRTRHWSKDWLPEVAGRPADRRRPPARSLSASNCPSTSAISARWMAFGCVAGPACSRWRPCCGRGSSVSPRADARWTASTAKWSSSTITLIGQDFYNRVSGMVEAFMTMRQELEAEKRALSTCWKKRERQLERVLVNTSGLYGDLQGIIGSTLPEIRGMSLDALGSGDLLDGKALPDGEETNA